VQSAQQPAVHAVCNVLLRLIDSSQVTCPRCKLESPPRSERCDCGFLFNAPLDERSTRDRTRFGIFSKIVYGSFVERFVFLTIFILPVGAVLGFKTLRKMGIFGGIVSLLIGSLVASFLGTAKWTLIHRLIDKKTTDLPPRE
jgi:hypothetical protein